MMGSRILSPAVDFACHNEEVRRVWGSYNAGRPIRVPLGNFTLEPRIWIQDPRLNTSGVTWESFTNDPEVMFTTLLRYSHHVAHHIPHDIEMGVPEKHWEI